MNNIPDVKRDYIDGLRNKLRKLWGEMDDVCKEKVALEAEIAALKGRVATLTTESRNWQVAADGWEYSYDAAVRKLNDATKELDALKSARQDSPAHRKHEPTAKLPYMLEHFPDRYSEMGVVINQIIQYLKERE